MALKRSILSASIIVSALLIGCMPEGKYIVARVGNRAITLSEFEKDFARGRAENIIKSATMELKRNHLQKMIEKRLKIIQAYKRGYDRDKEILEKVKRAEKKDVYFNCVQREVIDKQVSEAEIREVYKYHNIEIKVRHILLKMSPNPTQEEERQTLRKAHQILKRIRAGEDFAELARQYSQDQNTLKKGGDLGYIRWGWMPREFDKVAFNMKVGQVSQPVKTQWGYHIIKVEDRRVFPPKDYEQEKSRIKKLLLRTLKKRQLQEYFDKYLEEIKRQYKVRYYADNIKLFATRLSQASEKWKRSKKKGTSGRFQQFSEVSEEDKKLILVASRIGRITIGDVIDIIEREYPPQGQPQLANEQGIRRWLDRRLRRDLISDRGYKKRLHKRKEIQRGLRWYKESLMLYKIQKEEVDDKIKITEQQMRDYFEKNRAKYKNPEKVHVQEILVKDGKLAKDIARRAKAGEDFTELAKKYNQREVSKKKNGDLGYISRGAYGKVGEVAFTMEVGQIAGPIPIGNRWLSIIKVLDKKEERLKTFDEVKDLVKADLSRELVKRRTAQWIEEIKKHVKVRIYDQVLKKAFKRRLNR